MENSYEATGFVESEGKRVKVTPIGSITDVGNVLNEYTIDWNDVNEKNYQIVNELGTLEVTKPEQSVTVKVFGKKATKVYNGESQVEKDVEYKFFLGDKQINPKVQIEYPIEEYTARGTDAGTYSMNLDAREFKVSGLDENNYDFQFEIAEDGWLKITPAPLKIKTEGKSKVYDGTPLTNENYVVSGFVNGEDKKVKIKTAGTITNVGITTNSYTIDWGGVNKDNYKLEETLGELEVTKPQGKVIVEIKGKQDTRTYTGLPQSETDFEYSFSLNGAEIQPNVFIEYPAEKYASSGTDTGTYLMNLNSENFSVSGPDEKNYDYEFVIVEDGFLTITPARLTVVTGSMSKAYDGEALTYSEGTVLTGLVNDETATVNTTGSITDVGETDNTYEIAWDGTAKANNYEVVNETLGKLTVVAAPYSVESRGYTGTYDGRPHGITVDVPDDAEVTYDTDNAYTDVS